MQWEKTQTQISIMLRFRIGPDHDSLRDLDLIPESSVWVVLAILSANQYSQVILATKPLIILTCPTLGFVYCDSYSFLVG